MWPRSSKRAFYAKSQPPLARLSLASTPTSRPLSLPLSQASYPRAGS